MQAGRLPKRFPVGTKYIIEGKSCGEGQVHILSRYIVLPDGRSFDLPADSPGPGAIAHQRRGGLTSAKRH